MNFGEAVTSAYRNIFNYNGRAARSEFWWFQLFLVPFALPFLFDGIFLVLLQFPTIFVNLLSAFLLISLLADVALTVRRLHDQDFSGFWILAIIVPIIGPLYNIYLMLLSGTEGPNRFGPPRVAARSEAPDLPPDHTEAERLEVLIDSVIDQDAADRFCQAYERKAFQECWDCLVAAGVKNEDIYSFIAAVREDGFVPQKLLGRQSSGD